MGNRSDPRQRAARRRFLKTIPAAVAAGLAGPALARQAQEQQRLDKATLECGERIMGIDFSDAEQEAALSGVNTNLSNFERLRSFQIPPETEPPLTFRPYLPGKKPRAGATPNARIKIATSAPPGPRRTNVEDLAFLPVTALSALVRKREVSATELTRMYLERLKKHGPALNCVVTLTEELALEQAAKADKEIKSGRYMGPLHGIPWGAKDLFATKGILTTWGAAPYQNQVFDYDATVVERLRDAGAVLVAKLSLGALAQGDNWFRGQTKNPWNGRGSSGSSAGPGSATAAGLVGFSLGTETRGSIISPSAVNGVVGLRPTYGRVSRHGAMALSWTMDKIGPMCRSVEDCALVFNAIYGPDGRDDSVIDAPFEWHPDIPLSKLRIGYVKTEFEPQLPDGRGGGRGDAGGRGRGGLTPEQQRAQEEGRLKILNEVLDVYRKAGAAIQPIDVPGLDITAALNFILSVEAAAAFDDLTRSKDIGDKSLNTWPNTFRTSRYVPAVEYIRAQRARAVVIREMEKLMSQYDAFISPTSSRSLSLTNLTGHPAIALRAGFLEDSPVDFMITGRLYDEGTLMRVALAHEQATKWHERIPNLY
jgi:Asp-tRNA(Asn)/Glu-tRNA(Gln) amidotransferase A subunit family amidase